MKHSVRKRAEKGRPFIKWQVGNWIMIWETSSLNPTHIKFISFTKMDCRGISEYLIK